MWEDFVALRRFLPLVGALVSSSLRTENVGTILGYVWWLLHPLIQMVAYVVFIDLILKAGSQRFPLFILTSVVAWKYFTSGVRNAITTTLAKEQQMRQVAFPKVVLPLSAVLAETVRFGFGLIVVIFAAFFWHRYPNPETPLVLLVVVVQLVFTLALSVVLSATNFFLRDTLNFVTYIFPLWFYLSPGLYSIDRIPPQYLRIYMLNPFATIFPSYHAILLDHQEPPFLRLGIIFAVSSLLLVVFYAVFVRMQSSFAKVN